MQPVVIWSQVEADAKTLPYPYAHISISSPLGRRATLPDTPLRLTTLFLEFSDVPTSGPDDAPVYIPNDLSQFVLPTRELCESILAFTDEWKDKVEGFVVNCEAGISRSAAVAEVLARRYGVEVSTDKQFSPNRPMHAFFKELSS